METPAPSFITDLSWNDASTTRTAAQHEGEFADLSQTGWYDPSYVPRARRQDQRQHQHGHHELREMGESSQPSQEGERVKCEPWKKICTFIITRVSVSTSRMVSSYSTNVGNTWNPTKVSQNTKKRKIKAHQQVEEDISLRSLHRAWPIEAKKMMVRKSLIGSTHPMTSVVTMWPCVDSKAPARKQPSSMETSKNSVTCRRKSNTLNTTEQRWLPSQWTLGFKDQGEFVGVCTVSMKKTKADMPSTRISLLSLLSACSFL